MVYVLPCSLCYMCYDSLVETVDWTSVLCGTGEGNIDPGLGYVVLGMMRRQMAADSDQSSCVEPMAEA